MTNKKLGLASGMAAFTFAMAGSIASLSAAHADSEIVLNAAGAQAGVQVAIGQCPCIRWQIKTPIGQGRFETNDILISSQALFEYSQTNSMNMQALTSQTFSAGQIEVTAKGANVGIGFNGVQWGQDKDRGYSNLLRTGFYALYNIYNQGGVGAPLENATSIRVDAHAGYDWDSFVSIVNHQGVRGLFNTAASMQLISGPWSAGANARVGFETDDQFFNPNNMVVGANANVRFEAVKFSDFVLGLSAQIGVEHDGFREMLGLNPNNAVASVLMDLTWKETSGSN